MPDNNKYLALTAGPIYKTLLRAQKTRELWAASYTFSHLTREVIRRLREKNLSFVLPYAGEMQGGNYLPATTGAAALFLPQGERTDARTKLGAGFFNDRFIAEATPGFGFKELQEAVSEVLHSFSKKVATDLKLDENEVFLYFDDYFQLYLLEASVPEGGNVITKLMPYLDSLELQRNFPQRSRNYLDRFFSAVTTTFFVKEAFKDAEDKGFHSFETLVEVAARDFAHTDRFKELHKERTANYPNQRAVTPDDDAPGDEPDNDAELDQLLVEYLAENFSVKTGNTPIFKVAHKYVAIVWADGDRIRDLNESLTPDRYQPFSKLLSEYALDAVQLIAGYGGMPVFAGGDDLLFFAPVIREYGETNCPHIFELLEKLNAAFSDKFKDWDVQPTLSFGLSISYYKFPLYEALDETKRLLFEEAKKKVKGKNAVAFRVLKHSGHAFGGAFKLGSKSYLQFKNLLGDSLANPDFRLSSIVYKIQANQAVFSAIGHDAAAVGHFIDNCFNERVHEERGSAHDYLAAVKNLLPGLFEESENPEHALKRAYSLLRTVSFLTSTQV